MIALSFAAALMLALLHLFVRLLSPILSAPRSPSSTSSVTIPISVA